MLGDLFEAVADTVLQPVKDVANVADNLIDGDIDPSAAKRLLGVAVVGLGQAELFEMLSKVEPY